MKPESESIWDYAVFGPGNALREVDVLQSFTPSFARLPDIVEETYFQMLSEADNVMQYLSKELLMYYSTALLWGRLLSIKERNKKSSLSLNEKNYLELLKSQVFNIPQPILLFLKAVGNVRDQSDKLFYLADHSLPTVVIEDFGGYHSSIIDQDSHNIYEELPCLGVVGDTLMALAGSEHSPLEPSIKPVPKERTPTPALCGYYGKSGVRKEDLAMTLNSHGVTPDYFNETVPNTRLNFGLVQYVSEILPSITPLAELYMEREKIEELTTNGDVTQLISMLPTSDNAQVTTKWTQLIARPYCANRESNATIGATYFTGYQLWKEDIEFSHQNWCCLRETQHWSVPEDWIQNRNERRAVPEGLEVRRYFAYSDSLLTRTRNVIRRLKEAPFRTA